MSGSIIVFKTGDYGPLTSGFYDFTLRKAHVKCGLGGTDHKVTIRGRK